MTDNDEETLARQLDEHPEPVLLQPRKKIAIVTGGQGIEVKVDKGYEIVKKP